MFENEVQPGSTHAGFVFERVAVVQLGVTTHTERWVGQGQDKGIFQCGWLDPGCWKPPAYVQRVGELLCNSAGL